MKASEAEIGFARRNGSTRKIERDPEGRGSYVVIQGRVFHAFPFCAMAQGVAERMQAARTWLNMFTVYYESGMKLREVAMCCGVSISTAETVARLLGLKRGKGFRVRQAARGRAAR